MRVLSILKKDLTILLRNRAELAVLFLMPLAFILPISFALGGGDGYGINRANNKILVPLVDYDGGPHALALTVSIGESLAPEREFDAAFLTRLGLDDDPECKAYVTGDENTAEPKETSTPEPTQTAAAATATAAVTVTSTTQAGTAAAPTATETTAATVTAPAEATETLPAYPEPDSTPSTPSQATETLPAYPESSAIGGIGAGEAEILQTDMPAGETTTPATTEMAEPAEAVSAIPPGACAELAARTMLQRSMRTAAIIIPPGFSAAIDSGEPVEVTLLFDPTGDSVRMQQIEGVARGAAVKLSLQNQLADGMGQMADLTMFAPENVRDPMRVVAENPALTVEQMPAIRLEKVSPTSVELRPTPNTYQQTIPGYAVMFVFFIITSLSASIRSERLNGTFRRMLSMPVGRGELLAGKMLASIVIGVTQVIVLFVVGALVFRMGLGNSPLAFLVLTIALVACAAALGLAASTTRIKGAGLAAPLIIAALLGGCMFPPDLMPPFLRALSYAVPHRWALNGYQNLLVRGLGFEQVAPQIAALLLFTALFFFFAVRRFDFTSQED